MTITGFFEDAVMKISGFVLTLTCLLVIGPTLMAQDYEDEERDALELTFYSGFGLPSGGLGDWNDSLGAKTGLLFGLDLGYFLTEDMVLGFNFTYGQYGVDSPGDLPGLKHRFYNPSLYLKYYFWGDGDLVPYLKGSLGVDNAKFTTGVAKLDDTSGTARHRELSYDPALSFGLTAGAFLYTSDYSGLFLDVTYHQGFTEKSEKVYDGVTYLFGENASVIEIHAGINIYFSAGE